MKTIHEELSATSYPGRGIMIGLSPDGKKAVTAYFIMGRSENSRNRIFVLDDEDIRTKAFDESKVTDPSLIIYKPVRVMGGTTIVTNGDQTDTIFDGLKNGKSFEQSLRTRTFEPDEPNFTPRISGIITLNDTDVEYKLSILKSCNGHSNSIQRFFFEYSKPLSGQGHFIHTYIKDANPLTSFCGEPHLVKISGNLEQFGDDIWQSLNNDNKISLFTRFIDIKTGISQTRIINKNI